MEIHNIGEILSLPNFTEIKIQTHIDKLEVLDTRKGDKLAIASLSDGTGEIKAIIFPKIYGQHADILGSPAKKICIVGLIDREENDIRLMVYELSEVQQV